MDGLEEKSIYSTIFRLYYYYYLYGLLAFNQLKSK